MTHQVLIVFKLEESEAVGVSCSTLLCNFLVAPSRKYVQYLQLAKFRECWASFDKIFATPHNIPRFNMTPTHA